MLKYSFGFLSLTLLGGALGGRSQYTSHSALPFSFSDQLQV